MKALPEGSICPTTGLVVGPSAMPEDQNERGLPLHLGGHQGVCHTDRGALDWAIKKFSVESVLDIGCGIGTMVSFAVRRGLRAKGIDGDYTLEETWREAGERDNGSPLDITIHDFVMGTCPAINDIRFDLAWSTEFLEHVDEEYIGGFMHAFQAAKYVICTAAPPDAPGTHHVNCQTSEYWISEFHKYGFCYNADLTAELRENSTMRTDQPHNPSCGRDFMEKNSMFFENIFPDGIYIEMDIEEWGRSVEKYYELWWI